MLIDTHAHVNFVAYKDDGDEVVERALRENTWMVNVGSERDTSRRAVEYAKKYPKGVYAAVGLHPIHLREQNIGEQIGPVRNKPNSLSELGKDNLNSSSRQISYSTQISNGVDEYESSEFKTSAEKFDYDYYQELAKDDKVVAIGETGLDYYHIDKPKLKAQSLKIQAQNQNLEHLKNLQKEVLLEQIALAQELDKPVIFHCREAHNDLLTILKEWDLVGNKKLRGVIHSFSGRWSQAQQYLAMGFYLGFNGIITFARDYDRVIKQMPLAQLILETDCPYLTPWPFRGKRNEPSYVKYVAQKVAELRGTSVEEVAEITTKNARTLFNI